MVEEVEDSSAELVALREVVPGVELLVVCAELEVKAVLLELGPV